MMGSKAKRNSLLLLVGAIALSGMTCPVTPLPFARITSVQLFDQANYTVAFSVESAVLDSSALAQVNWVFGDGSGFVEGPADRATIQHIYIAPGDYEVTAYLFDSNGFVDQLSTVITVAANGEPGPNPTPGEEDLPTKASGPSPANGAENVSVDVELSWLAGLDATSHDVYFGTGEDAVTNADTGDAAIFKGNQTETTFDPGDLLPDTEYFWRVDEVNSFGSTKGDVYSFTTGEAPGAVKSPVPADGSMSARVDQILRWTAGMGATSHDVYFGKNMSDVANATNDDDEFQGNQSAANFDPEDAAATEDGLLLPNTSYFWRIDEVGPGGTTAGPVFTFKTAATPAKIMMPVPADGSTDVNVEQVLSWTAAPGVESFDVYFGTDQVEVEAADRTSVEFAGNRTGKTFDPTIIGGTTYFWRVDTLGPGGTTQGDVLSFTTADPPGQVVGPFLPAQNSTNVDIETDLDWSAGVGGVTTSYTSYLSTNAAAVTNGQASALLQTQDASSTIIIRDSDEALMPDTTYFWRIDANGPGGTTTGAVLTFTTGSVPQIALTPTPAIGQRGVPLDTALSWMPGAGATAFDVYLATSQNEVQSGSQQTAAFKGTVAVTNFVPAAELDGNTEYFWRVDAKGAGGLATGTIWRFTTAPDRAEQPMPLQNAMNVALDISLSWTAGDGAVTHDVYLGTDLLAVTNATTGDAEFQGNQPGTTFVPAMSLDGNMTYFWRIDEVGADGTTKGLIWTFSTGAGQAGLVSPADGADLVELMPMLQWTAGDGAMMHDVYLGTSESDVENATRGTVSIFRITKMLGDETYTPPTRLAGSTIHYWRIDSVTATGTTKGEVWQFRTRPGRASNPMPANLATDVATSQNLSWTGDAEALRFETFFGTNMADVTAAEVGALPGGVTLFETEDAAADPTGLIGGTAYFWRVDTVAGDDMTRTRGAVWKFTTATSQPPAQANLPTPFSGATNIALSPTLMWGAAARADSYDVYFGTNMVDVQNATTASAEFQGNQTTRTFNVGPLSANTTHFWRIDARNDVGVTTGVVWSFTTGN